METIRGVNLGGWLVLERWMSPSLFEGSQADDEYSLCRELGDQAESRLKGHRDGFIVESDLADIAAMGMNTVRLPVGYWLFGGEPPFVGGGDRYVDRLFRWADQYGLGVIIDLHAAPGSQNGWDHSGQGGRAAWHLDDSYIERTLLFLDRLTKRWGAEPALIGVELLNEPHPNVPIDRLVDYYRRGRDVVRANSRDRVQVLVHDGFRPQEMAKALQKARLDDLVLDIHLYQLFTDQDRQLDLKGHTKKADKEWGRLLKRLTKRRQVVVGEWSMAMHQTDGPSYQAGDYEQYFRAQLTTFAKRRVGWIYWTARVEGGGPWSLLDHGDLLVRTGN